MRHHPPRAICLLGLICLLASVLLPANEAAAHPIDEYVQNTYIDPAPDRTTLELNLIPGVLVAPQVVALIDTDGDGEISETEGEAYTNEVLRDISLEVDGEPQPLTLASSQFPTPLDMRAGLGTIRLQAARKGQRAPWRASTLLPQRSPARLQQVPGQRLQEERRSRDRQAGSRRAPAQYTSGLHRHARRFCGARSRQRTQRG